MRVLRQWLDRATFGQPKNFIHMSLWRMFDGIVASMPSAVMIFATYVFLTPVLEPGTALPVASLWQLFAFLIIQTVAYFFVARQAYIAICVGYADTVKDSRLKMGEHLRRLPMGFYNRRDAGDLSTVLLRDYGTVENFGGDLLSRACTTIVRFVLVVVIFAFVDWRMMLALVTVIPLAFPVVFVGYRMLDRVGAQLSKTQQESASRTLEYLGGIQTLKAFDMSGKKFGALKDSFDRLRRLSIRKEAVVGPLAVIGRFILNCGIGVVMLAGVYFFLGGTLSPFLLIVFLMVALNLYEPIMTLFYYIVDYSSLNRSAERIEAVFEEPVLPDPEVDTIPNRYDIDFNRVSFGYGQQTVLHDISLSIPQNGLTALVGFSGSGKSTVTRLIARFWDVDRGEITLGGVPLTRMKTNTLLSYISMVFQDVYLFQDTVMANIRMGRPDATDDEVFEAARRAACHEFISVLPNGYSTVVGEGGSTLSGGEKQRISIARALLKDAPIAFGPYRMPTG